MGTINLGTINLGYDVPYAIAKRYGLLVEEAEYFKALDDKDLMAEFEGRLQRAKNAAKRAEGVIAAIKEQAPGTPVSDIAAVLKREHRYTQSQILDVALSIVEAFATFGPEDCDGRNEHGVKVCKAFNEKVLGNHW